ncbi:MAG: Peroxiredoxin [Acidobacteria bacterium]|jgi:peroxiredoxin Q/BCP|nr:Peroxiredoxin [Acidobacteriota bacterium]
MDQFNKLGAAVIGISADDVGQQAKFRDKYSLNMPLLADADKKVLTAYGVFKQKSLYGKSFLGIERTTIIIGKDGIIKKIFPKVKVEGHVDQVLETLASL